MRVAVGMMVLFACVWSPLAQDTDSDIPTFSNTDAGSEVVESLPESPDEAPAAAPDTQEIETAPAREDDWVEQSTGIVAPSEAGTRAIDSLNAYMDGEEPSANSDAAADESVFPDPSENLLDAFFSMLRGLTIVLALMFFLYYLARRFGKKMPVLAGSQLGNLMGTLHLSKDSSLHFVKTGGRVLVIGVNAHSMSPIAEFDAVTFDGLDAVEGASDEFSPDSFLSQLQTQSSLLNSANQDDQDELSEVEDDDITALRGDIHRLQQYLRDESRGSGDSKI